LATALVRLSHLVQRVFSDVSREHGLPPQQLQLLCMLIDGPAGMSELCRLMNLERSGMTGLVDRVEKRRLIARASDPADRRACLVSLTGKGRRLAVAAHDDITTRLESMTEELDLGDRDCLVSVTTRLLAKHDPALVSDR
jgi:DNA-binding MarR family transcriptional regulator